MVKMQCVTIYPNIYECVSDYMKNHHEIYVNSSKYYMDDTDFFSTDVWLSTPAAIQCNIYNSNMSADVASRFLVEPHFCKIKVSVFTVYFRSMSLNHNQHLSGSIKSNKESQFDKRQISRHHSLFTSNN